VIVRVLRTRRAFAISWLAAVRLDVDRRRLDRSLTRLREVS
jgi:hypothetical protein